MENKISVIIPVFNMYGYLSRCLDSIINQSYRNLEILLINDGSSDGSGGLCDEYARKDKRIKVFHQENRGVSAARNTGLENACGEFVIFLDSDDYLERKMLEKMIHINRGADIIICNLYEEYVNRKELFYKGCLIENYNDTGALKELFSVWEKPVFLGHLGNKLFRKTVVQDLRFNSDYAIYEDLLFVIQAISNSSNIRYLSFSGYHYIQRLNSIMYSGFSVKTYSSISCALEIYSLIKDRYPMFAKDAQHFYIIANLKQATLCLISKGSLKYLGEIRENLLSERPLVEDFSLFTMKEKMYFKLLCRDIRIFTIFYKLFVMRKRMKYEKLRQEELFSS